MSKDTPQIPEETLRDTVRQLNKAVEALTEVIKSDYPTRAEIRTRRRNLVVGMVAAILVSHFAAISTVSYCFLDGIPKAGDKLYCRIIPGYEATFDNNKAAANERADLRFRINMLEQRLRDK